LTSLGQLAIDRSDFASGRSFLEEGLSIQLRLGRRGAVWSYLRLGDAAFYEGDLARARTYFNNSLALGKETGRTTIVRWAVIHLGQVALHQGDAIRARELLGSVWSLFGKSQSNFRNAEMIQFVEALANLAVAEGRPERGARLFAWVAARRLVSGMGESQSDRKMVELGGMSAIRSQLDEAAVASATAAGEAMALEEAVALGLYQSLLT
jgi:hypothetical protein